MAVADDIQAMVDRETTAWNERDAEALVDLFHPDTVWPWPPDSKSHDPASWVLPMGRFDRVRWRKAWEDLFGSHSLERNNRTTVKIVVSAEGDGAFAVVDVDTLWKNKTTGELSHWYGRACKVYTLRQGRWYFIFQTGLLSYKGEA